MEDMVRGDGQWWGGGTHGKHCPSFGVVHKNCLSLGILKAGNSYKSYLGRKMGLLALRRVSVQIWFNPWHLQLQLTSGWGVKKRCPNLMLYVAATPAGRAWPGVRGLEGVTVPLGADLQQVGRLSHDGDTWL